MIEVKIFKDNSDIIGLEIKGHSSNISREKEIVCAAVSSLSLTSLLGIINYLNVDCDYTMDNGYLFFKIKNYCNLDYNVKSNIQCILNIILMGIKNISLNYKNHITFL